MLAIDHKGLDGHQRPFWVCTLQGVLCMCGVEKIEQFDSVLCRECVNKEEQYVSCCIQNQCLSESHNWGCHLHQGRVGCMRTPSEL
jgi:hypothetical protein